MIIYLKLPSIYHCKLYDSDNIQTYKLRFNCNAAIPPESGNCDIVMAALFLSSSL